MPRLKDDAIVLRETDWSETSQVVTLMTASHGKVRGLAKGAKRLSPSSVSRYSGGFSPLTRGQIVGTIKPAAGLATLTEWDLQEPYAHFRSDLDAQHLGLYAVDLVNALLAEDDPHPGTFAALASLLGELARDDEPTRAAALLRFQWRVLTDCGFGPELDKDVCSGQPLPETGQLVFDPQAGGLSAAGHASGQEDTAGPWRIRRETVTLLRALSAGKLPHADAAAEAEADANVDLASLQRGNRLLCAYARSLLDRPLPTMALILRRS